jgi:hypothetical protein
MHAVGQQSTVETLTTVAMETNKHATMEATSVFYVVWPQPARNTIIKYWLKKVNDKAVLLRPLDKKMSFHAFFVSALDGGEWSLPHTGRSGARERSPCTLMIAGFMGPRARLDVAAKKNADLFHRLVPMLSEIFWLPFWQGTSPITFLPRRWISMKTFLIKLYKNPSKYLNVTRTLMTNVPIFLRVINL